MNLLFTREILYTKMTKVAYAAWRYMNKQVWTKTKIFKMSWKIGALDTL